MLFGLVDSADILIDFAPAIEKKLREEVVNFQFIQRTAVNKLSLPSAVKDVLAEGVDAVIVMATVTEEESKRSSYRSIIDAIISIELESEKDVFKVFIFSDELNSAVSFEEKKKEVAETWSRLILDKLFNPEKLAEKKGSMESESDVEIKFGDLLQPNK